VSVSASGPADITIEQFHELADQYLEALIEKLEGLQEETEEVDVEYSVCAPPRFLI
jgi:frataxin